MDEGVEVVVDDGGREDPEARGDGEGALVGGNVPTHLFGFEPDEDLNSYPRPLGCNSGRRRAQAPGPS